MATQIFFLLIVFGSAFFYEILALALIDRIGLEDRYASSSGMVIRTYGMMGIGAAISLWLFGITETTLYGLLGTLACCILLTAIATSKRNADNNIVRMFSSANEL